jgi:hypothetical protein
VVAGVSENISAQGFDASNIPKSFLNEHKHRRNKMADVWVYVSGLQCGYT